MKRFISYMLVIAIVFSFSIVGLGEVVRNETVYVNLDHNGYAKNIKVVTRISGDSSEKYYVEHGELENIKVLTKGTMPIVKNGTLKWDVNKLREKDIYYEGNTNKKLPLDLEIKYYLDGKELDGKELAGKSGTLEISIEIKNSDDLTTQIQLPLNLDIFKNVESEKGVMSVVGRTMTVVFTHLPMGNEKFKVKADGKNMELDPITISLADSSGLLGEGLGELDKFIDAMEEMSKANEELEEGSKELGRGMKLLKDGIKSLGDGVAKFVKGLRELGLNLKTLVEGFREINGGLGQLSEGLNEGIKSVGDMDTGLKNLSSEGENIEKGIDGLRGGLKEITTGYNSVGEGLGSMSQGHDSLSQLAQGLLNSSDPMVKALADGVIREGEALKDLSQGMSQLNTAMNGVVQNTDKLSEGYKAYNMGINQISVGFSQFSGEIQTLPHEINKIYQGHSKLVDGLDALYQAMDNAHKGGDDLSKGADTIPKEIDKIIDGQDKITQGLGKMREDGFEEITKNIEKFSNGGDSKEFTSFLDERNSENSSCQILMRTPPIKVEKEEIKAEHPRVEERTFFQRILELFKTFKR